MIAELLLAAALWCWDPVTPTVNMPVDGYRFYIALVRVDGETQELPAFNNCIRIETQETCVPDPPLTPMVGEMFMFVVTAFNEYGESSTEHGPVEGPCP